jgi:DNA-binding response OmpR family regulator
MPAKNPSKAVVLVADDEPSMLSLIAQHVKTLGHDVHIAHDGEEAWDKVQKHQPDLVLLDVMMPAMSGWEVCRKVREDANLDRVGVIMITGIGETLNELTSPLFGADAYLDKPFELVDLDRSIREVLVKRRSGPDAEPKAAASKQPKSGKSKVAAKVKGE